MSTVVPSEKTPLSIDDAVRIIRGAVLARGGDDELARLVTAQSDLETGRWQSIYNWNFGNIRGTYQGMTTSIPGATEYDDDGNLVVVPSGFRAYPGPDEGIDDKIDQLIRNFPGAWAAREPSAFVDGLWTGRLGSYFGVPPKDPFGAEGRRARDRYERVLRERYELLYGEPAGFPEGRTLDESPKAKGGPSSPFSSSVSGRRLLRVERDGDADLVVLRLGSHGPLVCVWQCLAGGLKADGDYGPKTKARTSELQRLWGLDDDGEVGPVTWSRRVLG